MRAYLTDTLYRRTESAPSAGLLSRLAAAEVDGQRLTHDEILGFLQLLVVGGQETTTNLVNNAVLSLLENPAQLARVVSDRTLLPSAIEETLRYRAPFQWLMRTPTRDVELHGQTLPAGRLILAMVGAANRDPARFPDPDRFDVTRDPNPHIAFGHGNHFCLGAALARLEARVALGDLLDRTRDLARTTDDPWEPRKALQVLGPARLPVRFTSA
jgi:cytochrome P450